MLGLELYTSWKAVVLEGWKAVGLEGCRAGRL